MSLLKPTAICDRLAGAPNARFWVIAGSSEPCDVKITLRPGQTLNYSYGGPHEEGWSRSSWSWTHEGDRVVCRWCEDGRDCDGRLTHDGSEWCPIDALQAGNMVRVKNPKHDGTWKTPSMIDDPDGRRFPDWQEGDPCRVYDQYAVAAGY